MAEKVYRGFDADELTTQYSPSLTVSDAPQQIQHWQESSHRFRENVASNAVYDIAYGGSIGERMDIFGTNTSDAPVHVYIHGGYWQRTDKTDYSYLAEKLVADGAVVVVPNYNLCPAVGIEDIVEEMRRLLTWVFRNIAQYGGDPEQIHISGHSAGGHLTAMMALTDWNSLNSDLPPNLVKSGVSISGVFELEPLIHTPINEPLHLDRQSAKALSPLFMTADHVPPLSFAVGGEESSEFKRQSEAMLSHWQSLGGETNNFLCPNRNHFTVIGDIADTDSQLYAEIAGHLFVQH